MERSQWKAESSKRQVVQGDALAWLEAQPVLEGSSLISSLPDYSEFPRLSLAEWQAWFVRAAGLILSRCPDSGVVIFYQRDGKKDGAWVDKSYLCMKAAEQAGHALLWHKIVCRAPAGAVTFGKPAYSHLLCFSKSLRLELADSTADILTQPGKATWARGMGVNVGRMACRFVLEHTKTRTIVNPFCGHGTVLAVANAMGLDAIGIELSRKRAEKARELTATKLLWERDASGNPALSVHEAPQIVRAPKA